MIAVQEHSNGALECQFTHNPETGKASITWIENAPVFFHNVTETIKLDALCESECITDLQQGSDFCYSADVLTVHGEEYILLNGNGWKVKCRYPFFPDAGYVILAGETAQRFKRLAAEDLIPDWSQVFTGDYADLRAQQL